MRGKVRQIDCVQWQWALRQTLGLDTYPIKSDKNSWANDCCGKHVGKINKVPRFFTIWLYCFNLCDFYAELTLQVFMECVGRPKSAIWSVSVILNPIIELGVRVRVLPLPRQHQRHQVKLIQRPRWLRMTAVPSGPLNFVTEEKNNCLNL